ncbi:hypothetical protein [Neptunitalea lumnitzerae]|uniref:Uncharacterized protein n=1 Tax=Neptunitalea lumnitzerae TaxID=2965509 RepID=A0ABQ5MKD6_9FLAO|nr:hypothetical protein [Neptunitalea sp. Y10]GLB49859.1 hypothetical protein Y10_22270 [Neptunitalea sp. Y10]
MKNLLTLVFTFISLCLFAQSENRQKKIDTVDVTYSIYKLFSDIRLQQEISELKIEFDTITKSEFEIYREKYGQKIDTISNTTTSRKNCFSIRIADTIFKFPSIMGRSHYYGGFYPKLKCHLVKVAGEGICEMFLIDQKTGTGLALPAFYDGSCNQPMISNDNQFLMTYGTCSEGNGCFNYYEHISMISIINLKDTNSITELTNFRVIGINDFAIKDIFWIDNNFIVLKVFDEIAFDEKGHDYLKNIRYIKGKIKW